MIKQALFILFLFITYSLQGQQFCMNYTLIYEVVSDNGVNMRVGKSVHSRKVGSIPYGVEVEVCSSFHGDVEVDVQGKSGYWMRCKYGDIIGYIHSANLEQVSCNPSDDFHVSFPDDNGYDQTYIGFPLSCEGDYGIYTENGDDYKSAKIEYSNIFTNYTNLFFGKLREGDLPYLLVHGGIVSPKGRFSKKEGLFHLDEEYEYIDVNSGDKFIFRCTGDFHEDASPNTIKDYSIQLLKDGKNIDLIKMDLFAKDETTFEGGVWLKWIGDLNGDGIIEIILKVQPTYKGWKYLHYELLNGQLIKSEVGQASSC